LETQAQLANFLRHMGYYGNAIFIIDLAAWAEVSTNTVYNATSRVTVAIFDLHHSVISPPTNKECNTIRQFCGKILAVNKTSIKLYQKPAFYSTLYFNKNSDYAIAFQVCLLYVGYFVLLIF
ncbi:hypothetical protein OBBRIDRAFT_741774, partial [Obba rivulosa]